MKLQTFGSLDLKWWLKVANEMGGKESTLFFSR